MDELVKEFASIVKNPYPRLSQWKKDTGKKIIGCFPMYVQEEIMHAAGILPVTLLGSDEEITVADQYTHPYICQFVRGNFDLSLKGELDFLDGVVFSDFCLTVQMLIDMWTHHKPDCFYHYLMLPKNVRAPHAKKFVLRQFNGLKEALEKLIGNEISENSIKNSILVYNENRTLLHRLYRLRRDNPDLFRARDIVTIVAAGMLMPKEEHSRLLSQLIERVPENTPSSNDKVRLILSGCLCDEPELDILDLVEELGAVVLDDDLYVGRRYFHSLIPEDVSPMEALAQHYINNIACPTKIDSENSWSDYLLCLVRETKADGLVSVVLKYCEPHLYDLPQITETLSKEGVPNFVIETTHSGATGQMRTRFQAFLETLDL